MNDYSITVTYALEDLVLDPEIIFDVLGSDMVMSISGNELSVSSSTEADDPISALRDEEGYIRSRIASAGILIGQVVQSEVMIWERFEREVDTPNYPDLVSAAEVGEILGVSRQRVHQLLTEHKKFPPAFMRLGSGPLWIRSTIEAFDRSWTRKPGRPAGPKAAAKKAPARRAAGARITAPRPRVRQST